MNFENLNQGNETKPAQNPILIADDRDRALRQYAVPVFHDLNPGIRRPKIEAQQFELKPVMFQMLQIVGQFSRMLTEDPYIHLRPFIEGQSSSLVEFIATKFHFNMARVSRKIPNEVFPA